MRLTNARSGPAWHASARQQRRQARVRPARRPHKLYIGPLLVLIFIVIEALLIARIAGQATSQDPSWSLFARVLWITDFLVEPFRDVRPEPAFKHTGVVEFSTLLAFEAYLVAGLVLVALVQLTRVSASVVRFSRRRSRKPTVVLMEPAAAQQTESSRAA